ncbi:mediator of RNA polymerase II transcription subunit 33A isoform X2 [Amborella trichopoda]|uniref:mediator of RNA polymerase II transcription subunit 33A isoform X2 n=1 Tax=Amborella trichopoda TaxID=13333 RepID=UPI0009C0BD69|nr:mediator of RNA polymerase II transcription subunit 33A isoform X2 [Amborella trichopoda]|eukprot:XP_020521729.1 mediator of RNA polymerase II transcription subunit 33A isoform X2 [Amborella trichopoda]
MEDQISGILRHSLERKDPPLIWAMEVSSALQESGVGLPSSELGHLLVSHLCWANNTPLLWKYIEHAVSSQLVSSLQLLALLTSRVIPQRLNQPEAYRLYLELVSRYAFSFLSTKAAPCKEKILKSVDDTLQLSHIFGVKVVELGQAVVLFLFSVISTLVDCTLEDWGLQGTAREKNGLYGTAGAGDMDIDVKGNIKGNKNDRLLEHRDHLRSMNSYAAIEVVGKLFESKKSSRLQYLEAHKSKLPNMKVGTPLIGKLSGALQRVLERENQLNKCQVIRAMIDIGCSNSVLRHNFGVAHSASWISFDLYMENVMDGKQLPATSAIEILSELIKTLKVMNRASWQETFQSLWISALRLVQRERDPLEGPVPHLDARLCVLLSITPLAAARVIEEDMEDSSLINGGVTQNSGTTDEHGKDGNLPTSRRQGLISSLQVLGQFSGLLLPPPSVVPAANLAAAKAAGFVSDSFNGASRSDTSVKAVGDMRHLIVEACIARKLIDTSAYFWPGFVGRSVTPPRPDTTLPPVSPWSAFMKGDPLNTLKYALSMTPAASLAELEKIYHIALTGAEEERIAAARILCGASLIRGFNIQEHVVRFVVKLLSPPAPPDFTGPGSHLVSYTSMLQAVLFGLSSIDTVHILSLYGVIPEVAAALMPISETFGTLMPASDPKPSGGEENPAYMVFSCAFLFLLRLWKFYRPPHEHYIVGRGPPLFSGLTLEYLLLLHNGRVASNATKGTNEKTGKRENQHSIYIDSFPKLRAWYRQNQACIASTLSGLCSGNPVHQVANKILSMIYKKMNKGGVNGPNTPSSGSLSGSPRNGEDSGQRPMIPAWEVLEAIPFVLEAVLTACAHRKLSSRDLTTGLRDLVDFLPASIGTIISYFSAEVSRGIWKPVAMNGTDWPSPAANLLSIEAEMKEILAATGVELPSSYSGGLAQMTLPLPMAALVSLTITFKLDKSLEFIHSVVGPALESAASGCPWPSMPIIGALWAQKVRRWHDFIVFSCSRSVFKQDKDAIFQLLKSCFSAFLGPSGLVGLGGVGALVGNGVANRASWGGRMPVAPGFLFLRTCRTIHNVSFVTEAILKLVVETARDLSKLPEPLIGSSQRLRSCQVSLSGTAASVREAAMLGASLLCLAGGPQQVQLLYEETLPTWLLSGGPRAMGPQARRPILEGYAMAYLLVLCGCFMWGPTEESGPPGIAMVRRRARARVVGRHMEFLGGALDGEISSSMMEWVRAYVVSFLAVVVRMVPWWISEVESDVVRRVADGLRGLGEGELALALLERGGLGAMSCAAEMFMTGP